MLQTNKLARKLAPGIQHMEAKRMITEDSLGAARQSIDKVGATAAAVLAQAQAIALVAEAVGTASASSSGAPAPPEPKFRPGQSVCHWWASWFKECSKAPKQYRGKKRPAWFSGEVLSHDGWQTQHYAGCQVEAHFYRVRCWSGTEESVPVLETFLAPHQGQGHSEAAC